VNLWSICEFVIMTKIHSYKKIAFNFLFLALILMGIIVYFVFYKVEIFITPIEETISVDFPIQIIEKSSELKTADNVIVGFIEEFETEGEKEFSTSGEKEVSSEAVGKVYIINNEKFDQPLIATTRLLTPDNVLLRIKHGVTVPAMGRVEAEAYVDDNDFQGIIKPTKMTIPGLASYLQKTIYAENKDALGGTRKIKILSQEDINVSRETLAEELEAKAKEEFSLRRKNKIGFNLIGKIPKIKNVEWKKVILSRADKEVGEEAEKFNLYLKIKAIDISFDEQDIRSLAEKKLLEAIPDDKEFIELDKNSFNYVVDNFDINKKTAQIKVYVSGKMVISKSDRILNKDDMVGSAIEEVKNNIKRSPAIEAVDIKTPFNLLKTIPKNKNKIKIIIKESK